MPLPQLRRSRLAETGVMIDMTCPLCGTAPDMLFHRLWICPAVRKQRLEVVSDDVVRQAIAAGPALAAALAAGGVAVDSAAGVVDLVRAGNAAAVQEVRRAGRDIGEVLAAMVNLMNPSAVVIGGRLADAGEHLMAGIREVVYQRSLPLATEHLRIVASKAGAQAGVLGAATMAAEHVLSPEAIEAASVGVT